MGLGGGGGAGGGGWGGGGGGGGGGKRKVKERGQEKKGVPFLLPCALISHASLPP